MFCKNCGKRIENNIGFCPACGMKLNDASISGECQGVCTMKKYYSEINQKRLSFFKKSGITLSVIFILLTTLLISLLWLSVAELSVRRDEVSRYDNLIDTMIDDPSKLEKDDVDDIAELFDFTDDEHEELEERYADGKLRDFSDVKKYLNFERTLTLLLSNSVTNGYASVVITVFTVVALAVTLVASASMLLVILAIATNCRSLSVWALTLASLATVPSLFTLLPLFILTFIVEKMVAKNDRIYEKYIEKLGG